MTEPARVSVPASVARPSRDLDVECADRPRPSPVPATARASLTRSSRSRGLSRVMSGQSVGMDVDPVGDELDVRVVVEQRRDRHAG